MLHLHVDGVGRGAASLEGRQAGRYGFYVERILYVRAACERGKVRMIATMSLRQIGKNTMAFFVP